ncbi:hypothetical protein GYA49_01645 [Candidatus Beckwithbacteria bacterium]|nr:hypothetical protein [Candidatus Beckwithbacteria bacterium]
MNQNLSQFIPSAVILTGGSCSRFHPFSYPGAKANFVLMGQPILAHTISSLISVGITDIHIVKSPQDTAIESIANIFQDKAQITFYNQEQALGQGHAILQVKDKIKHRFLVCNQQHITVAEHLQLLPSFLQDNQIPEDGVIQYTKETDEPEKYGILTIDGINISQVVEKPQDMKGKTGFRIVGLYVLSPEFLEILEQTPLEEYQFENALTTYGQQGKYFALKTDLEVPTLKYPWDIFTIANCLFNNFKNDPQISSDAFIHPTAIIEGPVVIEVGTQIYEYAIIKGPVYIGKNVVVGSYCKVRKGAVLEEGAQIQSHGEISHSYLGPNTHIHSGFIGDSILGQDCRIGANFVTANRRLDRQDIKCFIKNELRDSHQSYLGCIVGNNVKIGIHCGTNPGIIIPPDNQILPGTIVNKDTTYA